MSARTAYGPKLHRLGLDWAEAKTDLSLRCAKRPNRWICHQKAVLVFFR